MRPPSPQPSTAAATPGSSPAVQPEHVRGDTGRRAFFLVDEMGYYQQRRSNGLRIFLLAGVLVGWALSLMSCVVASGDGQHWSYKSLGTDAGKLAVSGSGLTADALNQSVTSNATLKAVKSAWSNYLMAEGIKWMAGKYYDLQGAEVSAAQATQLEQLRNAKSVADSQAALQTLKVTTAAEAVIP